MEINQKVKIDLMQFLKAGKFDCIDLGQEKSWILEHFPRPDEDYASLNSDEFEIVSYGSVELHFQNKILYLIFSDHINHKKSKKAFYTGKKLEFTNQSFFGKTGKSLKLPYVMMALIKEKINYQIVWSKHGFDAVEVITEGGVSLLFEPKDDPDKIKTYRLVAMSLLKKIRD